MAPRALSEDHRAWIVENLLAGVAEADLVAELVPELSRTRARAEVRAIAKSPLLAVCARLAKRARQLELVAALGRSHARGEPAPTAVERRTMPPADELFRHYWAAHRPVVIVDALAGSPALKKWTPSWFAKQFRGESVEVTAEREADPHYDMNFRAHRKRMRMEAFIAKVLAAGSTNDLYMVSNNRTMMRPRFRALLADIRAPRDVFEPLQPDATSLWIGPAGTITPLHHDTTNILFTQIHGTKRIELISPQETALLLDPVHGFYSPIELERLADAKHPALRAMLVKSVELGPGESLFIPAGWWHRVTSLSVSISFSLLGFRRPNDFDWYRPGHF